MEHFKVIKINIALLFAVILLQFISNASLVPKPFHKPKKVRMPTEVKEHLKKLMENRVVQISDHDHEGDIVAETKQVLQKSHESFHHLEVTIHKLEEELEKEVFEIPKVYFCCDVKYFPSSCTDAMQSCHH
ncbi:hypothetical protein T10_9434 [Trichinella papuae]|uniref:Uncharacterized protein n=1 Tax=Trichinella papuae TaxID=268474 RepID=A0A0V1MBE8_9BILA|nr:hypothetical protein T10_9434 [Trichinella papuae]